MKNDTISQLIFIGPLPPPTHGMSAMNEAILNRLSNEGIQINVINTAAKSLNRNFLSRLSKLPSIILGWFKLTRLLYRPSRKIVYISLAGGLGKIYDLFMVITARFFGARFTFHHHTFALLLQKSVLSKIIFSIAGKKTNHIVLCKIMASQLEEQYNVCNVMVVSNIASMPIMTGCRRKRLKTVGFIGNITIEKGGVSVIELAKKIAVKKLPINLIVAGPCAETSLSKSLLQADKDGILSWIGPVYEEDKTVFLSSIDTLIMPTQYPNEAEPLVVWEALGTGSPVIAYNRGCISEQLIAGAGKFFSKEKNFASETLPILEYWLSKPSEYKKFSSNALATYQNVMAERDSGWSRLRKHLSPKTLD